jgi:hypothetical protein
MPSKSAEYERQADNQRTEYSEYTRQKIAETCVGIPDLEVIKCRYDAFDAQREYNNNQSDLIAQRQSALWAYIMGAAAVIGMALSAVGIWFIKRTLDATLEAVEDTGKATTAMLRQNELTEHAQRPWIKISAELISVKSTERRIITIDWRVKFENIGQMVAHNYQPLVKFVPMDEQFLTSIAAHMDSFPGKLQEIDSVLIPKDENVYKGRSTQAIEYLPWQTSDGFRKDCVLMLIAMARYRIPGDDKWRVSMQGFAIAEALGNVDDCHFTYDFPDDLSIETMHVRKLGRSRAT